MLARKLKVKFSRHRGPAPRARPSSPSRRLSGTIFMETVPPQLHPKLLEYKERIHQLETCYRITSLLNSELNQTNLLDTIMKIARKVMRADASSLLLIDERTGDLVFQVALSRVGAQIKELTRVKMGEGIAGAVAKTGRALIIKDAYKSKKFNPAYDRKTGFKTGSILCAPLKAKDKIIGVCQVIHRQGSGKVFTRKDLSLFRLFCDSAALAIQNARIHHILMEKQRLEKDMEFAQSVQESFLPQKAPEHPNFQFAASSIPAQNVGGDYYDFIQLGPSTLGILLGDVSGKGVSAALQMARLMSDFRYVSTKNSEPRDVLREVNNIFFERSYRGMFTTVVYMVLNLNRRRASIANAGHLPVLLQRRGGPVEEVAHASGTPLGMLPQTQYQQVELDLHPGDRLVVLSDGVIETKSEQEELFGQERLVRFLEQEAGEPAVLLMQLEKTLTAFSGKAPQFDDKTAVALQAR